MELRHLRCFVAVAEELHFARAAERLHIEQSPLSRAIKELEYNLGVRLFERTTRRTRLTWAGKVLLEEAHRIFAAIDQAKASVKAAATGYHVRLRIALSDGIAQPRISTLLAQCRNGMKCATCRTVDLEGALDRRNHWEKTSHALLVGAILHVLYAGEDKTLRGVANFLSDPACPFEVTLHRMMTTPHLGETPHPVVASAAREVLNKSDNERSGVLSTAMSFLGLYRDPTVAEVTIRPRISTKFFASTSRSYSPRQAHERAASDTKLTPDHPINVGLPDPTGRSVIGIAVLR
jgi:ferredoxin